MSFLTNAFAELITLIQYAEVRISMYIHLFIQQSLLGAYKQESHGLG